jgi:hypothetical protein
VASRLGNVNYAVAPYELARRVLTGVYRVRDAIRHVRSPLMSSSEYAGRPDRPADVREGDPKDLAYAYEQRFVPLQEAFSNLQVDLLEAEAIWTDDIRSRADDLRSCVAQLFISVRSYIDVKANPHDQVDPEYLENLRSVIFFINQTDPGDEYTTKVSSSVERFEQLLRPHLRQADAPYR